MVVGFMIRLVFQRWVTMPISMCRGIDLAVQIDIFNCDVQDSRDCQGLQFCTYTGYIDNDFTTVIKCSWALQIKTCFTLGLIYWLMVWNMFPYIGHHNPNWLVFFRGVETTNQYSCEFPQGSLFRHQNHWALGSSDMPSAPRGGFHDGFVE